MPLIAAILAAMLALLGYLVKQSKLWKTSVEVRFDEFANKLSETNVNVATLTGEVRGFLSGYQRGYDTAKKEA